MVRYGRIKPLLPAGRIFSRDFNYKNMSLDVILLKKFHVTYDNGKTLEEKEERVFDANITHNLGLMADKAGIYFALWRPEEIGKTKASEIVELLEKGLTNLKSRPEYFETFNYENGWGMYKNFVPFVEKYLEACKEFPNATIEVSR